MSGRRKDVRVNKLVDEYLKRSTALDGRLEDIKSEVDEHNKRIAKRHQLEDKLTDLSDLITDAECSIDGLRERYHDASFRGDEHALTTIQHQRTSLLSAINGYKKEIAETQAELESVVIDGAAIAELSAELDAGVRTPDYREFLKVLQEDCKARAANQDKRLKELRSKVPAQFKDQTAYDAARKELDSSYRTSEESERVRNRIQAQREEERRRFLKHNPLSPSQRAQRNRANEARAAQAPVQVQEW